MIDDSVLKGSEYSTGFHGFRQAYTPHTVLFSKNQNWKQRGSIINAEGLMAVMVKTVVFWL
jgi:hypothetical protein